VYMTIDQLRSMRKCKNMFTNTLHSDAL